MSAPPAPILRIAAAVVAPASQQASPRAQQAASAEFQAWPDTVQPIITDAERDSYRNLHNDVEREQFVQQFWLRRDPTPGTPENEFRDEYERRFTYANEHFTLPSGVAGSKTDRGKIYILNGTPDELQKHPAGGGYYRSAQPGGNVTKTFPFEVWRYRHLDGKGDNVEYEFVDSQLNGDYKLALAPASQSPVTSPN